MSLCFGLRALKACTGNEIKPKDKLPFQLARGPDFRFAGFFLVAMRSLRCTWHAGLHLDGAKTFERSRRPAIRRRTSRWMTCGRERLRYQAFLARSKLGGAQGAPFALNSPAETAMLRQSTVKAAHDERQPV